MYDTSTLAVTNSTLVDEKQEFLLNFRKVEVSLQIIKFKLRYKMRCSSGKSGSILEHEDPGSCSLHGSFLRWLRNWQGIVIFNRSYS
jgi:hypothetical protein